MGHSKPTNRRNERYNPTQDSLELDTSLALIESIEQLRTIVGNVGPANPTTEKEIEYHLTAALGAASHWRLETSIALGDFGTEKGVRHQK